MKSTFDIEDYHFECEDVEAEGWKGISVFKHGFEQPFYGFGGRGEAAFRIRCHEISDEITGKRR